MKFSDGTELRFNKAKNLQIMVRLLGTGGVLGVLSWFIAAPAKYWVEGIGTLALAAGLVVFLIGMIAGHKEFDSKHKRESK
jgi:hypothetical protein